jgi:hypothetical protein
LVSGNGSSFFSHWILDSGCDEAQHSSVASSPGANAWIAGVTLTDGEAEQNENESFLFVR